MNSIVTEFVLFLFRVCFLFVTVDTRTSVVVEFCWRSRKCHRPNVPSLSELCSFCRRLGWVNMYYVDVTISTDFWFKRVESLSKNANENRAIVIFNISILVRSEVIQISRRRAIVGILCISFRLIFVLLRNNETFGSRFGRRILVFVVCRWIVLSDYRLY